MKLISLYSCLLLVFVCFEVSGQSFVSKVSRDSVAVLSARTEVLKAAIKLNELKLNEAAQEADIEKQKIKIIELRSSEKSSTDESERMADALQKGTETDVKKAQKLSRRAASSSKSLQNAIAKLTRQIDKIEDTRILIQTEERKLANRTPVIIFSENNN